MALGRLGSYGRSLLHESCKRVFCANLVPGWIEPCVGAKRYLLTEDVLKLHEFQQRKLDVAHRYTGLPGNYIETVNRKLQKKELILRDELKLLLHLCQSAGDMVTARDAISRYHADNSNMAFGEFRFGPLFVRLCFELGLEEMALDTITDTSMKGFFDSTSFNITIDMLFTKGSYESGMEVLRTMKNQAVPFSKETFTLAAATCYKMNTPESFKFCTALIEEGKAKGMLITRHAYCFAIALALQQNDIERAESWYFLIMGTGNQLCQNLKVLLFTHLGAMTDAIAILSAAMLRKSAVVKKLEFSQELIDLLLLRSKTAPQAAHVWQIVSQLEQVSMVTQQTLDDMLCCTPRRKKHLAGIIEERRLSRRSRRPLHSKLLSE